MLRAWLAIFCAALVACAQNAPVVATTKYGVKHEHLSSEDIVAIKQLIARATREPIRTARWEEYASPTDIIEIHTAYPNEISGKLFMVQRLSGVWRIVWKSTWQE